MSTGFGNFTASANATTGVTFSSLYDPLHLLRVTKNLFYEKYSQSRFVPSNAGVKEMFAFRYKNLLPATTPLTEGVLPSGSTIVREKVSFGIAQYGDFIKYTDQLDTFDVDTMKTQFIDILGDQAALTHDVITRDVIYGGTQVIYANGATTRATVVSGTKKVIDGDLKLAVLKLKNAAAKKYTDIVSGSTKIATTPIRSAYLAFVHPNLVEDLRGLSGFVNVENYSFSEKAMEYEVGAIGDIRFLENNNAKTFVESATNVYTILIVAKDAYATVSVRGKGGTETIHKPITSGGVENALNQVGSIGWKMYAGAKILNDLFMVRIETLATYDVADSTPYTAQGTGA